MLRACSRGGRAGLAGCGVALLVVVAATQADASSPGGSPGLGEIAQTMQNPLARVRRFQIENNAQFGFGPDRELLNFLRIQPLIPFTLNKDWSLITRPLIPIVHQPWPESADGLGDVFLQFLLSRERARRFIWGAGPAFVLPTATDDVIGTGKWSAGPTLAGIYAGERWLVGAVASQVWSFAGDADRPDVRSLTLRPILHYNLPSGWALRSSPSIIADWEAESGSRWLVPLGAGVAKVFALRRGHLDVAVDGYYHVEAPRTGPEWQLRLQVTWLLRK